jgi:hypothetical protein
MFMIIVMKNVVAGSLASACRMMTNAAQAAGSMNCLEHQLAVNVGENAFMRRKKPSEANARSSGRQDKSAHYACESSPHRPCSSFAYTEVEEKQDWKTSQ